MRCVCVLLGTNHREYFPFYKKQRIDGHKIENGHFQSASFVLCQNLNCLLF